MSRNITRRRRTSEQDRRRHRQLEYVVRGFSNRNRIAMLELLARDPEQSVREVADALGLDYKLAAQHLDRLASRGLVMKRNEGVHVRHALSDRGKETLAFLCRIEALR